MHTDIRLLKRTPYAALLWSAMMPGFGQLYNRDFFIGAFLLVLEFGINTFANLNYIILQSFNLNHVNVTTTNLQWMMFYPGIWSYSMWQAYNRACEINCRIEGFGIEPARYTGLFVGLSVFMQFGIIWPVIHSQVISALLFGGVGALTGYLFEKQWYFRRNKAFINPQFELLLRTLRHLRNVSAWPASQRNFDQICDKIVETAIALSGADMGNLQLLDAERGLLKITACRGFEPAFREHFASVYRGQATCGEAMAKQKRIIIEDVSHSPMFAGRLDLDVMLAAGALAVQSTPLVTQEGRMVGVLSTHYRKVIQKDKLDLHFIDLLARQAANIIEQYSKQKN